MTKKQPKYKSKSCRTPEEFGAPCGVCIKCIESPQISNDLIFKRAVDIWGADAQVKMLLEEMSELAVAIYHKGRNRESNVEEEIADVYIVLAQMDHIFDKHMIQNIIKTKTNRLIGLVTSAEDLKELNNAKRI